MNVNAADKTRRFGRNQAVAGLDLEADGGVGLLGPNGRGQDLTAANDGDGDPADLGQAALLGRDPRVSDERREIRPRLGYLPQNLGDKARAKLRTLSGGMLRRVGIAQAIVSEL